MNLTIAQLRDHLTIDHHVSAITAPARKDGIVGWHQKLHVSLDASHAHDPKTGKSVPVGDTLI